MLEFGSLSDRLSDNHSFANIRSANKIYVDKTALIYELARNRRPRLLARPSGFGKSTIVSVLEELFSRGIEDYDGHPSYFKGLAIEKLWQERGGYKVLRLNFAEITSACSSAREFAARLLQELHRCAHRYGLDPDDSSEDPAAYFEALLQSCGRRQAVLLIDDYDDPLNHFAAAGRMDDFKQFSHLIQALFEKIKNNAGFTRCVFITGLTRYKDDFMLTQGSVIKDISQSLSCSTLCGLTEEEIRHDFKDHLLYVAARYFGCAPAEVTAVQIDALLDKLEEWYGGYCFDNFGQKRVFSFSSILAFFSEEQPRFRNYYLQSAGGSEFLLSVLNKIKALPDSKLLAGNSIAISRSDFLEASSAREMNPYAALFQCGCLTLKQGFLEKGLAEPILLQIPNYELKLSIESLLS